MVVAGLHVAREILIPVALAVLISFVLAPLTVILRRAGLARVPAAIVVVVVSFGAMLGIGALGTLQLSQLSEKLPQYQTNLRDKIRSMKGSSAGSGAVSRATSVLQDIGREITGGSVPDATAATPTLESRSGTPVPVEIRSSPPNPLRTAIGFVQPLLNPLASAGLVVLFVVFFLLQREDLRDRVIKLLGTSELYRTTEVMDESAARLSRYFLLQTALNAAFGAAVGIGLWIIGVPSPLLWGIFAMLMRFVPYVGSVIAAIFPVALAAAVDPGWTMVGWTVALFAIGEPIMGQVIEPMVFGAHTGLSPVAIVIAATFWTWLWGPIGLVLATPLTLCLVVLGSYTKRLQFLHVLLGDQPALTPQESFYQRLIAGDPSEVIEQADQQLKERTLIEYYEEVALKGLALAQRDMNNGDLPAERQTLLINGVHELVDDMADRDVGAISATAGGRGVGTPENDGAQRTAIAAGEISQKPAAIEVLCIGGRGAVDQAASTLLVQVLANKGIGAELNEDQGARGLEVANGSQSTIRLVCVSYVAYARPAHVRLMLRRVRRVYPRAVVVVCFFCMPSDSAMANELTAGEPHMHVTTTLAGAVEICTRELAGASDGASVKANVSAVSAAPRASRSSTSPDRAASPRLGGASR